jgi:hypothetical protein
MTTAHDQELTEAIQLVDRLIDRNLLTATESLDPVTLAAVLAHAVATVVAPGMTIKEVAIFAAQVARAVVVVRESRSARWRN